MTAKGLSVLLISVFALLASCDDGKKRLALLFDHDLLFAGISKNLEDYRENPDFEVFTDGPSNREEAGYMPGLWYVAESDDIVIAFWPRPGGEGSEDYALYALQFVEVKRNTEKYFLGRFVGMKSDEIFSIYPKPDDYEHVPSGSNSIFLYNAERSEFVMLWLNNDVVIRAGFAYSL